MKKKAQGLSINAIILIILGIAVLVVLIAGFVMGWDRIIPFLGEKNNVKTIVSACETACSTSSLYDYCSVKRELNGDDGKFQNVTCYMLASVGISDFIKYGVGNCSSLDCKGSVKCAELEKGYIDPKKKPVPVQVGVDKNTDYCIST